MITKCYKRRQMGECVELVNGEKLCEWCYTLIRNVIEDIKHENNKQDTKVTA